MKNNPFAKLAAMMGVTKKPKTDPRANSAEKIEHDDILPHVSRRALARVTDWAPPPETCNHCNGMVMLIPNSAIYGRSYGDWPYAYACTECDAYVGLHPHTDLPLGTLANKEERQARMENKRAFVQLQERLGISRREAYSWLAKELGIEISKCHWSMFGVDTATRAGEACRKTLEKMS